VVKQTMPGTSVITATSTADCTHCQQLQRTQRRRPIVRRTSTSSTRINRQTLC